MNRFNNIYAKQEEKKKINFIIISAIILILSFIFRYVTVTTSERITGKTTWIQNIIELKGEVKTDKKAYIDIESTPYLFAGYDKTSDGYYIVTDKNFLYIVYMNEDTFKKLSDPKLYDNNKTYRLVGLTKYTTDEIKNFAIEAYNKDIEQNKQINLATYDKYFGDVYLDLTESLLQKAMLPYITYLLLLLIGIVLLITGLIYFIVYEIRLRNLGDNLKSINDEMNSDEAIYYKKAKVYLTKNYIINFAGCGNFIKYSDILWIYPFEYRNDGRTTIQSIRLLTKDNKLLTIATLDALRKLDDGTFNEIWNKILNKNKEIIVGYTRENYIKAKEEIKKTKKSKNN